MMGERVAVLTRSTGGTDDMGEPVYEWTAETVSNCLVKPVTVSEGDTAERPDGVQVKYVVAFPKTYTGASLEHARLVLVDRGGDVSDPDKALKVSGAPDITRPCPTSWNMLVEAGVMDG